MPQYDLEAMKEEIVRTDKNIKTLQDEIDKLEGYKGRVRQWIEEQEAAQAEAQASQASG